MCCRCPLTDWMYRKQLEVIEPLLKSLVYVLSDKEITIKLEQTTNYVKLEQTTNYVHSRQYSTYVEFQGAHNAVPAERDGSVCVLGVGRVCVCSHALQRRRRG